MFKLGSKVTWKSHSLGCHTVKHGKIVKIIPEGEAARKYGYKPKGGQEGGPRNHESYLVEVKVGKTGKRTKLYWPRVSQLRRD